MCFREFSGYRYGFTTKNLVRQKGEKQDSPQRHTEFAEFLFSNSLSLRALRVSAVNHPTPCLFFVSSATNLSYFDAMFVVGFHCRS